MKNNTFISAYEKWLRTIDPNDYSIKTSSGEINAQQLLDEMENETKFGNNFCNSIENAHKKVAIEPLQQAKPDDFIIMTSDMDGNAISYNAEQILEQVITQKTGFGKNLGGAMLNVTIQAIMRSFKNKERGVEDPFTYTYFGFTKLTEEQQDKVFKKALEKNQPFCNAYFKKNPGTDWVIIAHKKRNIIMKGKCKNEPLSNETEKIAQKIGKVVFTYSREKIVEAKTKMIGKSDVLKNKTVEDVLFDKVLKEKLKGEYLIELRAFAKEKNKDFYNEGYTCSELIPEVEKETQLGLKALSSFIQVAIKVENGWDELGDLNDLCKPLDSF